MSDQDFNFNPPPRREAKKAFEPPPWERDQFDELNRRKQAEQETAAEQAEQADVTAALEEAAAKAAGPDETVVPTAVIGEGNVEMSSDTLVAGVADGGGDEDERIDAMLLGLKSEEPPFGRQLWKVSIVAGMVLAATGLIMTVWGVFAIAATGRTGALGSLGGGILVAFGLGFSGVGVWMAFRTLRQRGVL